MTWRIPMIGLVAISLSGCGSLVETSIYGGARVNAAGPSQTLQPYKSIEKIDLIATIDPKGHRPNQEVTDDETRIALEKAFANFYASPEAIGNPTLLANRRDQIQDRIMIASAQSCNVYQVYLQRLQSETNFLFGGASTILGGLSTIFTSEGITRLLAGSAAITGGLRAEFNQDFLFGQLVPVITKGIEKKRESVKRDIQKKRFMTDGSSTSVQRYTLQAAIADAVEYHRACTISAALEEAVDSLERADNPGLQAAMRIQYMVNDLQNAANGQKPRFAPYYDPDSPELPGAKNSYVSLPQPNAQVGGTLPAESIALAGSHFIAAHVNLEAEVKRVSEATNDGRSQIVKASLADIAKAIDGTKKATEELADRLRCLDRTLVLTGTVAQARADFSANPTSDNRTKVLKADLAAYEKVGGPIDAITPILSEKAQAFSIAIGADAGESYERNLKEAVKGLEQIAPAIGVVLARTEMTCK